MRKFDGDADPRWPDGAHDSVGWYVRVPKVSATMIFMERYNPIGATELNASYLDGLEGDVQKVAKDGDKISEFFAEEITTPLEGIHYSFRRTRRDGTATYEFWYVTGWQHKVFMQTTSPTRGEPKWFRGVAQSLQWLKSP